MNVNCPKDVEASSYKLQLVPKHQVDNKPTIGVIHTIVGRSIVGGTSLFTRRTYARVVQVGALHQRGRDQIITFSGIYAEGIQTSYEDAIVVSLTIVNYDIKRILVDNGSFVDIIFYDAFDKMSLPRDRL